MKSTFLKKFLIVLPVLILTYLYIRVRIRDSIGLLDIVVNIIPLYIFILIDLSRSRRQTLFVMTTKSVFYIYIFMVLALTIFFIHIKVILAPGFAEHIRYRVVHEEGVNLVPLTMFKEYKNIFNRQIIGNFIMLLPLGIFLPILYKRLYSFMPVVLISLLISTSIELIQLISNSRRTDIDDVILNMSGAVVGILLYKIGKWQYKIN